MKMFITITMLGLVLMMNAAAAQTIYWERTEETVNTGKYFDQEHHEEYIREALAEITGKQPRPDTTREELAEIVLDELNKLPVYGQRQVAMLAPEIPYWVMRGYESLNPASLSHSRYLDGVVAGEFMPETDLGVLYTFWCIYDAEWFALSRNPAYKAWISAVLMEYPPLWQALRVADEEELHDGLVVPLQTRDEPYREIDHWINAYTKSEQAFAKPKVRDALVEELLQEAGNDADERFFAREAYGDIAATIPGLSERKFYLLAALGVEFSQEIYELEPETKQMLYFRDFFVSVFDYHREKGK